MREALIIVALAGLAGCDAQPGGARQDATALAAALEQAGAPPLTAGAVTLSGGWIRQPPERVATATGFLTIQTRGGAQDALIGVVSPRARRVEVHETVLENGVMATRRRNAVVLMPAEPVRFERGGLQIMFFELTGPLAPGEDVAVTFKFAKQGDVTYAMKVAAPADDERGAAASR